MLSASTEIDCPRCTNDTNYAENGVSRNQTRGRTAVRDVDEGHCLHPCSYPLASRDNRLRLRPAYQRNSRQV